MTKKKFVLSGAGVALAVIAVLAVGLFGGQSPAAYAEQLTNQSLQNVAKLPPDARQDLDMRINGNATDELQAAEHAKDLKVLTYDQVKQLSTRVDSIAVHGPDSSGPGPVTPDLQSLKYLTYTDDQGATHIIGVDSHGLPAIIIVYRNSGNMHSGSVQVMGSGKGGTTVMDSAGGPAPAAGSQPSATSCSATADGEQHCTTNGSAATNPTCQTLSNGAVTCQQSAGSTTP